MNQLYFTYICTLLYTWLMTFVHIILWCDRHHNYQAELLHEMQHDKNKMTSTHPHDSSGMEMYTEYAFCYDVNYSTWYWQAGMYPRLNAHYKEWKDNVAGPHLVLKIAECLLDVFVQLFEVCFNLWFSILHWVLLTTKTIIIYKMKIIHFPSCLCFGPNHNFGF